MFLTEYVDLENGQNEQKEKLVIDPCCKPFWTIFLILVAIGVVIYAIIDMIHYGKH